MSLSFDEEFDKAFDRALDEEIEKAFDKWWDDYVQLQEPNNSRHDFFILNPSISFYLQKTPIN